MDTIKFEVSEDIELAAPKVLQEFNGGLTTRGHRSSGHKFYKAG